MTGGAWKMEYTEIFFYLILGICGVVMATGIVAFFMVRWICQSNEMGGETGSFQDFVLGDVEIIKEKDYRMNV